MSTNIPGTPNYLANLSGAKLWLYWGVGAIALIALAGTQSFGSAAIFLAVILVLGVLLIHWQDTYANFFKPFGFVFPGK